MLLVPSTDFCQAMNACGSLLATHKVSPAVCLLELATPPQVVHRQNNIPQEVSVMYLHT